MFVLQQLIEITEAGFIVKCEWNPVADGMTIRLSKDQHHHDICLDKVLLSRIIQNDDRNFFNFLVAKAMRIIDESIRRTTRDPA